MRNSARFHEVSPLRFWEPVPSGFRLQTATYSHGWVTLPPFRPLSEDGSFQVGARVGGRAAVVRVRPVRGGLSVEVEGTSGSRTRAAASQLVRRMLRLDESFSAFHAVARRSGRSWIAASGMGRLLRAPTVFEDLVKLVMTTNCSWSLTTIMCREVVRGLGIRGPGGDCAFPTPRAMALAPLRFYVRRAKAGYRARYLREVARLVASGTVNPEPWDRRARPTEELREEILAIPGAGPYVADNLLRLLGRYDALGLDSWVRGKLPKVLGRRRLSDRAIERRYERFGAWRGLFLWCDVTRDWFDRGRVASWLQEFVPRTGPDSGVLARDDGGS